MEADADQRVPAHFRKTSARQLAEFGTRVEPEDDPSVADVSGTVQSSALVDINRIASAITGGRKASIAEHLGYPASFAVGGDDDVVFSGSNQAAVDDADDVVERNGRFGQSRRKDHLPFADGCD